MVGMETLRSWAGYMMNSKSPLDKKVAMSNKSKKQSFNVESGLARASTSAFPSTWNVKRERIGPKRIEQDLGPILMEAWREGFMVQSNFARENAPKVAMAASMSLITTRVTEGVYSSTWLITAKGIRFLNELELIEKDDG